MKSADVSSSSAVSPADTARPTKAEVFEVIREIAIGLSETKPVIHEDTQIDRFFSEHCDEELDPLMLWFEIEAALGVRLDQDDWHFLSGEKLTRNEDDWRVRFAPMFTFGRLADLVHKRMPPERFEPLTILGSTSKAAGAFRWITWCATKITTDVEEFSPSTPIVERVRGRRLAEFWTRCRAVSGGRLPILRESPGQRLTGWLPLGLITIGAMVATFLITLGVAIMNGDGAVEGFKNALSLGLCLSLPILIALALLIAIVQSIVNFFSPPHSVLPVHIATFGDIARVIVGERGGWCVKCDYELTGIKSDRCPECGTMRTLWERSNLQFSRHDAKQDKSAS